MTENERRPRPVQTRRRRRRRRARLAKRVSSVTAIVVLALALIGFGAWRLLTRFPGLTIRHYPMEYEATIRACAQSEGIPPAYAAAVILAESSYRPDAVSSANAQGLMQLLPDTAAWIAGKFDEEYVEGCLFDPETNVRYGCWYLGFLMRRYDGDMRCASSAYHAGQGNVDKWLQNPEYSADGHTLDTIPYASTNTYVQRVLKYYEYYQPLYETT